MSGPEGAESKRTVSFDGVLPFDDKASPELIQREFGLSKNAFKRAVGRLMKQGRVEIRDGHIRAVNFKVSARIEDEK